MFGFMVSTLPLGLLCAAAIAGDPGDVSVVRSERKVVEFANGIDFGRFATFSYIDADKPDPLLDGLHGKLVAALASCGLEQRASGADLHLYTLGYPSTEAGAALSEDLLPSGQYRTNSSEEPSPGTLDDMNWKMPRQPSITGSAKFLHLHIDFVDPTTNETVWRAVGVARMRDGKPDKNRRVLRKLANKLLAEFPPD